MEGISTEERGRLARLITRLQDDPEGADETLAVEEVTQKSDAHTVGISGVAGAGKSTLGKLLAKKFEMEFVELDTLIQEDAGISVAEIFELEGPEGYRRREAHSLEQWLQSSPEEGVLAVPGGIVHSPSTWERLLGECHTVWLRARPEEHWDRVAAQGDTRPMAGDPGAMDRLRALLNERTPAYRRAEFHLDTRGRKVESCLKELEKTLKRVN